MSWKQLFEDPILDKGWDYYRHGRIQHVIMENDRIEAIVHGSSSYHVDIEWENKEILSLACDCPHARDGNYCKHMTAVLFQRDKALKQLGTYGEEAIKKEAVVNQADEAVVRKFLTDILIKDDKWYTRFKNEISDEISAVDMQKYKQQINQVFQAYTRRDNFIDYWHIGDFSLEMSEFLKEDIQIMLSKKQYKEAFELSMYIFEKTANQAMDGSLGDADMLMGNCVDVWQTIVTSDNGKIKQDIFQRCLTYLDTYHLEDYDYIETFLFTAFHEPFFLEEKRAYTQAKVEESKEGEDEWSYKYSTGKWVLRHLEILEQLGTSQEEIDTYCQDNLVLSPVRDYYITNCMERKDYDKAIHLLEEGKLVNDHYFITVQNYSIQLKELYQLTNNWTAYQKELWSLVLEYNPGNVELFKELKTLYSEKEWKEKREIIFTSVSSHYSLGVLYDTEGLHDRLWEMVKASAGLSELRNFEKSLKGKYPQEILAKYEKEVELMAEPVTNRRRYQEIVALLRSMQEYPGGKQKVMELMKKWRFIYDNRRAMMDELRKL